MAEAPLTERRNVDMAGLEQAARNADEEIMERLELRNMNQSLAAQFAFQHGSHKGRLPGAARAKQQQGLPPPNRVQKRLPLA